MRNFILGALYSFILVPTQQSLYAAEIGACPIGCAISSQQLKCAKQKPIIVEGGFVQYQGSASLPSQGPSAVQCGTLDETQACPSAWGVRYMDIEFPRFSFAVEKVGTSQIKVRAQYSWNGVNFDKSLPPFFNTFTAILEAIEVRVRAPSGLLIANRRFKLERYGLNYGGYFYKKDHACNVKRTTPNSGSDSYFLYDLQLESKQNIPDQSVVEVQAIGNYE